MGRFGQYSGIWGFYTLILRGRGDSRGVRGRREENRGARVRR
jgi:hypothetical protein